MRPLLRPIICICNDLYASSLTKLRPHARIIRLNRPNDFHLVKRLRDICETEKMHADSRALSALVGVSQGDLRGCLNTLQVRPSTFMGTAYTDGACHISSSKRGTNQ